MINNERNRTVLKVIMHNVLTLVSSDRFDDLDDIYAGIDFEDISIVELIAYIRTAYSYRNNLQQWHILVDKAYHQAVEEYDENRADRIFEGLR